MYSVHFNYITTKALLDSLTPEMQAKIEKNDIRKLNLYMQELNPASTNYSTLGEHRKIELEKRISELTKMIDTKLHPIHEKFSDTLIREKNALLELQQISIKDATQAQKLWSKFPFSRTKSRIEEMVWFLAWFENATLQCPKPEGFCKQMFRNGFTILNQPFPALAICRSGAAGTVIEQVLAEIESDLQIEQAKEAKDFDRVKQLSDERDAAVVQAFKNLHADEQNYLPKQIKQLFRQLPAHLKSQVPQPPYEGRGLNTQLHKTLGAHYDKNTGKTTFRVYAPQAQEIEVYLTAYRETKRKIPFVKGEKGIWTAESTEALPGSTYYFMIKDTRGNWLRKVDPFAFGNFIYCSEVGKDYHESVVRDTATEFAWTDQAWMDAGQASRSRLNILEVHPTMKNKPDGTPMNWRELAPFLADYLIENGFNAVELMAVFEHTQPISMGYQITNYFCTNSRYGTLEDFQYFVNYMHNVKLPNGKVGIAVLADWVPAHHALDRWTLHQFDGSYIYQDENSEYAYHPRWGSYEFCFYKKSVQEYLASNLDFVLSLHCDGVRMDAVASMLHLDYDRPFGFERKNRKGGTRNLEAIDFIRNLNAQTLKKYPNVRLIAEESSGFENLVLSPFTKGYKNKRGLGFTDGWNMPLKTNLLKFMQQSYEERQKEYPLLTNTLEYDDFKEQGSRLRGKSVIYFSHDECANGNNMVMKMPGSLAEKFANVKLALAYNIFRGGGDNLEIMGLNFAQKTEWHQLLKEGKETLDLKELTSKDEAYGFHLGALACSKKLHQMFWSPALSDQTDTGFEVFHQKDPTNSVVAFHRRGGGEQIACIFNFSKNNVPDYQLPLTASTSVEKLTKVEEVLNTDAVEFTGGERINKQIEIIRNDSNAPVALKLHVPPLTAVILKEHFA